MKAKIAFDEDEYYIILDCRVIARCKEKADAEMVRDCVNEKEKKVKLGLDTTPGRLKYTKD